MDYEIKYQEIKNKYKGIMTADGKKRKYRLLEVELDDKLRNIPTYDKDSIIKVSTIIVSFIAVTVSLIAPIKDTLKSDSLVNLWFLCVTIAIMLLCADIIITIIKIDKKNCKIKKNIKKQHDEITELKITQLVIKDLLLEEDSIEYN